MAQAVPTGDKTIPRELSFGFPFDIRISLGELRCVRPIGFYESDRTAIGSSVTGAAGWNYRRARVFGLSGFPVLRGETDGGKIARRVGGVVDLHAGPDSADLCDFVWKLHSSGNAKVGTGVVSPFGFIAHFWGSVPGFGRGSLHGACQSAFEPVPLLIHPCWIKPRHCLRPTREPLTSKRSQAARKAVRQTGHSRRKIFR
jgi:hypothetical protein